VLQRSLHVPLLLPDVTACYRRHLSLLLLQQHPVQQREASRHLWLQLLLLYATEWNHLLLLHPREHLRLAAAVTN
jgi:hypothetical protein